MIHWARLIPSAKEKFFEFNFKIEFDVASVDNFFPVFIGYGQAENVYLVTDLKVYEFNAP